MKKFLIVLSILMITLFGGIYISNILKQKAIENNEKLALEFLTSINSKVEGTKEQGIELGKSKVKSGAVVVDKSIDSKTGSALLNLWSKHRSFAPITDSQLTIQGDSATYKGKVIVSQAIRYAKIAGIPQDAIDKAVAYIEPLGAKIPITVQGGVSITNNITDLNLKSIMVGIIPVPMDLINKYNSNFESMVASELTSDSRYKVDSMTISDGKVNFKGVVPAIINYK